MSKKHTGPNTGSAATEPRKLSTFVYRLRERVADLFAGNRSTSVNPGNDSVAVQSDMEQKSCSFCTVLAAIANSEGDVDLMKSYLQDRAVIWEDTSVDPEFVVPAVRTLLTYPHCQAILTIRTRNLKESLCKALFVQTALVELCTCPGRNDCRRDRTTLLNALLREGASILGWLPYHARSMEAACCTMIEKNSEFDFDWSESSGDVCRAVQIFWHAVWVEGRPLCTRCASNGGWPLQREVTQFYPPCMLPAAMCLTGLDGFSEEKIDLLPAVIAASNLSWLKSPDDIPFTLREHDYYELLRGTLHNGPTCDDHTAMNDKGIKRHITLPKLTCQGSTVHSLQSLSRNAVHRSLVEHHLDPFTAAQSLPLPNMMKQYLFSP